MRDLDIGVKGSAGNTAVMPTTMEALLARTVATASNLEEACGQVHQALDRLAGSVPSPSLLSKEGKDAGPEGAVGMIEDQITRISMLASRLMNAAERLNRLV